MTKEMHNNRTRGFVALTSVLILGALFLSISIGAASKSISAAGAHTDFVSSLAARVAADGCVEHALIELQRTLNYTGEETLSFGGVDCDVETVTGEGPENRTIQASSTAFSHAHKDEVQVGDVNKEVAIDYWLAVTSF